MPVPCDDPREPRSDVLWQYLPDDILLNVFTFLEAKSLICTGLTCKSWHRITQDEFLWKDLFYRDFKISREIPIAPGKTSWKEEYERLTSKPPVQESQVLSHDNQVLHVSFSHNGEMFASCSKDGFIKIWNSCYPATLKYSADMKNFSWKYTQFSQFNEPDTLLLVSGVHFGSHSTSGEIAVFSLEDEFALQCRVLNKPYDVFGTWYNDNCLLSGELKWLGHLVSSTVLWLNKASQEAHTENKSVVTPLYRFYNRSASSIRTIMVANFIPNPDSAEAPTEQPIKENAENKKENEEEASERVSTSRGNPLSHRSFSTHEQLAYYAPHQGQLQRSQSDPILAEPYMDMDRPFLYNDEYRLAESNDGCYRWVAPPVEASGSGHTVSSESSMESDKESSLDDEEDDVPFDSLTKSKISNTIQEKNPMLGMSGVEAGNIVPEETNGDSVLDSREKYLIFTTGSKTYTPHQIGFKRIKPFKFKDTINLSLQQKIAEHRERQALQSPQEPFAPLSEHAILNKFDSVDHLIDLHGHIIGMALSPDHRYLYINSRPWPKNYHIEHALTPPPIAQEIDIHVIDMITLKEVGTMLRSHKAYTPNDECFFIFLDVSNEYVASGAEDRHGYLWDRHYGICLAKLPHQDVVNSVAFNPQNPEMLITASDDHTLKIWRSNSQHKQNLRSEVLEN